MSEKWKARTTWTIPTYTFGLICSIKLLVQGTLVGIVEDATVQAVGIITILTIEAIGWIVLMPGLDWLMNIVEFFNILGECMILGLALSPPDPCTGFLPDIVEKLMLAVAILGVLPVEVLRNT